MATHSSLVEGSPIVTDDTNSPFSGYSLDPDKRDVDNQIIPQLPTAPLYQPRTLGTPPRHEASSLVRPAREGRLVVYAGAGLSMAPPSCGPTGSQVAHRLKPDAAAILGVSATDLDGCSLEELSQRVADAGGTGLEVLRDRAARTFAFLDMDPNFGHEAAALLLREGLLKLISVNWDCAVERAGLRMDVRIESVATAIEALTGTNLPLYKVHGCASRPPTLALTQGEVDRPQTWAVARVQAALTGGTVVFIGLGTVGMYVSEPVQELLNVWALATNSVRVVDPTMTAQWREALGDSAEDTHIPCTADEFLDDFLRAAVQEALHEVNAAARLLAEHEVWGGVVEAGVQHLIHALDDVTALALLRWWRDGVAPTRAGLPFITELPGQRALLTMALLAEQDPGQVVATGQLGRLTVRSSERYFEIASRPGQHLRTVEVAERARVERRQTEAVYALELPVTVIVSDALGEFPAHDAPPDIAAGSDDPTDIAVGPSSTSVRFVSAEDGVRGRLCV